MVERVVANLELQAFFCACNLRHKNLGDVEFNIYRTFVTRDDGLAIGVCC